MSGKEYTVNEIEDMAFQGRELPEEFNAAEVLLFLMFRNLYDFAKRVQMNPAQGKREKQRIWATCKKYALDQELAKYQAQVILETEQVRREYRKAPSLEAADRLMLALDNIPVKKPEGL